MFATALMLGWTSTLAAQRHCVVSDTSHEGRLLAFYTAPIAFAPITAPTEMAPGSIRLAGEAAYIPSVDTALQHTGIQTAQDKAAPCFNSKSENTDLSHVFPRPRLIIGLPSGFALELSYLPPVTVASATPNLASAALSWTRRLSPATLLQIRAHGTTGHVSGAITCPASALQTTADTLSCFAATGTVPSDDQFYPTMYGGDAAIGWTSGSGALSAFVGAGLTALQPSLHVHFASTFGGVPFTDTNTVATTTTRGAFTAGAAWHLIPALELGAQLYSVPADLTTFRVSAAYRLR
jgi:hypothetical protein